jgi:hypothetical protein
VYSAKRHGRPGRVLLAGAVGGGQSSGGVPVSCSLGRPREITIKARRRFFPPPRRRESLSGALLTRREDSYQAFVRESTLKTVAARQTSLSAFWRKGSDTDLFWSGHPEIPIGFGQFYRWYLGSARSDSTFDDCLSAKIDKWVSC